MSNRRKPTEAEFMHDDPEVRIDAWRRTALIALDELVDARQHIADLATQRANAAQAQLDAMTGG